MTSSANASTKRAIKKTATTPGIWRHSWRPIHFVLIVDNFGVEYMHKKDANHLAKILKTHHKISRDWERKNFQASTWSGTTLQTTQTELAACP